MFSHRRRRVAGELTNSGSISDETEKRERNYDIDLRGFGFGLLWCLGLVFSTIPAAMLCFAFYGLFFLSNMYVNVVLTMFFFYHCFSVTDVTHVSLS